MRAKTIQGSYYVCEGCDRKDTQQYDRNEPIQLTLRKGELNVIDGWKDPDGDWIGDTDEYPTSAAVVEDGSWDYDDIEEASYLECPDNSHDSDDGWEMEALDVAHYCGVCMKKYRALDDAAKCCEEGEEV